MGRGRRKHSSVFREALLALLVLAVTFLNFSTTTVSVASDDQTVVSAITVFCGDHPLSNDCGHVVCHACRPNIADLPPPPSTAVRVAFGATRVVYADAVADIDAAPVAVKPNPRGPPALA